MPWKLSFHLKLRISRISCRLQWCKGVRRGGAQLSNGKNKNKIWGHYRVHLEHSFRIHSFSKHSDFTVKCYRQYPFHQKVAPMVQYILHLYIFNRERERGREGERESGRRACMHACKKKTSRTSTRICMYVYVYIYTYIYIYIYRERDIYRRAHRCVYIYIDDSFICFFSAHFQIY
jgi:hypothetical protein